MTALEAFNALDNREVSRKEVEQVLTQAKAENNTAIIYRLSRVLNDSPEATHFEITITHYDSSVGLSGVQHTGDYREALDDCGRLRKGWKFLKGNVVKVEEKPKKEAKPKKEKAPQKDTKKDKKYKFVVITDDRSSRVIAVFSYTNPNIEELRERFWKNSEGKYYETTEEGLRNYNFGIGFYPFEEAKKHIEKKYTEGKDFIYFRIEEDGGRDEAISLVEKPKKEAKPKKKATPKKEETTKEVSDPKVKDFEAFDDLQVQLLAENADIPKSEVLDFLYNFTDAFEEGKTVFRFWNTPGKKPTEAVLQYKKHPLLTRLQNPSAKMRAYELTPRGYELIKKFNQGVEKIKEIYDINIIGIQRLTSELLRRRRYAEKQEETSNPLTKFREQAKEFHQKEKAPKSLKFSDIDYNKSLIESFTDKNTETNRLFVKDHSLGLTFSFSPVEKYMATEQIFTLYGKDRKEEAEKDFLRMKEEIAWAFNHHVKTAQREGTLEVCEKYFLENLPELLAKGGLWLEAKAKNKGAAAAKSSLTKLRRQVWEDIGALAVGESTENVQDSSKKKVEKAPNKATKSLKSKEGKVQSGEQKELDLYMQEMKMAIKESKAGKFDKKNILSWLSKFPDKVKGLLYNFLYHHYLLDQEEAKLRKSKKLVPFGLISVQAGISEFVSKLMDLEREDFFDLYFFFRDNMDECIELLEDKEVKKNYYEKKKKGLSGMDYSQGLFGDIGLNAPRHEGILKEALNECGRLKKGWKFEKGKAVKIDTKTNKEKGSKERFKKMSVPELREYTLEYYLENYGGKSISKNFFKEDNIQIEFFNTAGKKLQKPIYKEKVAVLEHLESLIKNSTYNNWGNRKESSPPNIIGYLNFKAKVTIDGEKRHVRISIAVDEKRKFRFKTLEVGANPKKKKQATSIPAPSVTERLRDSSLSEGKGTKKSLSRKKKEENFGLNASESPVTSLPVPRQTLAQQLATRPEVRESFLVADEQMSLFLGALEKKTKDSLVITLTGKQGSGKTRFAFQFMNALAQRYRVGHASIEEHPESVLYEEKAYQYLNDTALEHITAQDVRSLAELDTMIRTNEVIVIDSFQKMRELAPHFEIDKDLRKKYDGKLFLVIFQQTADGKMRGGSKSQYDGDIILFTETFPDYRENYVYPDKNRYNKRPATELQYSIYEQRMLATAPEVPALPAHYEPTESEELNFEVL
ncbi:LPD3 domain-containing protein [Capnocytophaga gingivalis]